VVTTHLMFHSSGRRREDVLPCSPSTVSADTAVQRRRPPIRFPVSRRASSRRAKQNWPDRDGRETAAWVRLGGGRLAARW